ncbi:MULTISPECIES: L-rhamnose mutarotase [unclassified Gordonia (in: high G+C Gram-positive bacteria)]|uniref:L-rhamnose mutarotase n=1 Tax=unclassified Gordonia (in: high G+C Gram-positive bacteria) TaxID=2657482 RepID=UPI000990A59F|nr:MULTISPECIES: L-rhamnose mutarotase [unclassified Gordonia (in: high G+C Gram-positive bacteria)]MCX2752913.1 L-rhamnose mutarotase [Gordonia sp. 4N]
MSDPQRVCFVLQLRPERVEDYLEAHTEVWPEMLDALRETGWRNYSLFLRKDDGMVVGYLETDDFATTTAAMEATDVSARWQAHMSEYFLPAAGGGAGGANPDTIRTELLEYFHLD